MEKNFFVKSHGLGNDYIVFDSELLDFSLTDEAVKTLCDVHFGIGSDGILLKEASNKADFGLKIYNPDASLAEKSGNGLRIFSKFLFDYGYTAEKCFSIETDGGIVQAEVTKTNTNGKAIEVQVEMGTATFKSSQVPVLSEMEESIEEELTIGDTIYLANCVSVGNPHCSIICDAISKEETIKVGSKIEKHERFPNRVNVQFVQIVSRESIKIEIWERGAGYTLASGSSSCAAAAIAYKLGHVDKNISVIMPGGTLAIEIGAGFEMKMTGAVAEIVSGTISPELFQQ